VKVGLEIAEGESLMKSRKQIYIEMLQQKFEYFPSIQEILQGICDAFQEFLKSNILN
jgi:hypothetical protein